MRQYFTGNRPSCVEITDTVALAFGLPRTVRSIVCSVFAPIRDGGVVIRVFPQEWSYETYRIPQP